MPELNYLFPMPLPRSLASDHCEAFLFDDPVKQMSIPEQESQTQTQPKSQPLCYPFPISEEIWKNLSFPQSLCIFGNACPVKVEDVEQSKSTIAICPVTKLLGCPFYLLDFSEFASFAECKEVEIFDFSAPEGKQFEKDADRIVENFSKLGKFHRAPIIVLGHDEGQELLAKEGLPAAGIVSNIKKIGTKLFSDFIDVPKKIADLINLGAYRFVSSEIYKNFFFNGEFVGPVLRRVALLGADVPKIKGLDDILARYSDSDPISFWIKKGEPSMKKQTFMIQNPSGNFSKGDKVTSGEANGIVDAVEGSTLIINCESEKEFKSGSQVVGPNGSGTLSETYPYPAPEKKAEQPVQPTQIPISTITVLPPTPAILPTPIPTQPQTLSLNAETLQSLAAKDKQIADLKKFSETLQSDISSIKTQLDKEKLEKESTKRISHAKDVEMFCEKLKSEHNLSAALIDESGFRTFAMAMDWQKVFKFAEKEPEKTPYEKFSELITSFAKAGKDGKLVVPVDRLVEGEENELGEFIPMNQEALNMDRMIAKFAEQNKCSYEKAFDELNKSGKLYQ